MSVARCVVCVPVYVEHYRPIVPHVSVGRFMVRYELNYLGSYCEGLSWNLIPDYPRLSSRGWCMAQKHHTNS